MDLKVFSSKRAERPSQPKLSNRPTSREFDKLRQEASLLREEARQVRLQSRDLRTQLHAVVADFHRERGRLAENGLVKVRACENILPIVTAADKLLPQDDALHQFSGSLLAAIEEERSRIARDLHDDLNQSVAWLQLKVAALRDGAASGEQRDAVLGTLAQGLRDLSAKLTDISRQLHPAIVTDLGLEAAMRSYVARFVRNEGILAVFRDRKVPSHIPPAIGIGLYRILQEALRNVSKHARTRRLTVTLAAVSRGRLRLVVRDYGVGFRSGLDNHGRGLGLISMEERARLLHGSFSICSPAGKGTQVEVVVPLPEAATAS